MTKYHSDAFYRSIALLTAGASCRTKRQGGIDAAMKSYRVAVLMGGDSSEREVSLRSGAGIAKALAQVGHKVLAVDVSWRWEQVSAQSECESTHEAGVQMRTSPTAPFKNGLRINENIAATACTPRELARQLLDFGTDVAFIALHGGYGEDGTIQAFLEFIGIPYTSPPPLACGLAMDKRLTKQLLVAHGLPTPDYFALHHAEWKRVGTDGVLERIMNSFKLPCVVKPACEGSTIGVTRVSSASALNDALMEAFRYGEWLIIERCICGTEVTGAVIGRGESAIALPLIEIVAKSAAGFYDYEAKYTPGMSDHIIPPRIPQRVQQRAQALALAVHKLLGCRGFTRTDMMVDEAGNVFALELNAVPGMTETSLVPDAARAYGWSFEQLVDWLVRETIAECTKPVEHQCR